MAEDNQEGKEQEEKKIAPPITPVTIKETDDSIDSKSSREDTTEKSKSGLDTPQPFIVKIEKEEKKGWLKTSEFISLFALLISITAVVLNKCSLDNTSRALAITDSSFKRNIFKDSLTNIEQVKKDAIAEEERKINRKYVDSTLSISNKGVNAANRSSQISEKALNETQKSYEFSRGSAMKELRAYQAIVEIKAVNFKKDSIFFVQAQVTNVGKTPAYKFKCEVTFVLNTSQDKVDVEKSFDIRSIASEITVGATQSTFHTNFSKAKVDQEVIDMMRAGKIKMFAAVRISYYDIFNSQHFTHGFYEYDIFKETFNICLRYNDAD